MGHLRSHKTNEIIKFSDDLTVRYEVWANGIKTVDIDSDLFTYSIINGGGYGVQVSEGMSEELVSTMCKKIAEAIIEYYEKEG